MLFTQSYGVTHPSQPNYLALFTGSTRGITSDVCPLELSGDNLASPLQAKGSEFWQLCGVHAGSRLRRLYLRCLHAQTQPAGQLESAKRITISPSVRFHSTLKILPRFRFVVPDQLNDMHDGSIAQGDAWLKQNIEPYAQWAMTHNSLLIVTWDEDDGTANNHIATIMIGPMVKRGSSVQRINHYNILRTLSEMYGLPSLNESAHVQPIAGVWQK